MIAYTNALNEFAIVEVIGDRSYTVNVYASEAALRSAEAPVRSITLAATPNGTDLVAALPGFDYVGDEELPLSASPPASVTAWQIRRWLLANGISMAAVDAALAAIPDPQQRALAQVDWEYAPIVQRSHPMLPMMAATLGIADIDAAFIEAERITG
jgi:hypothetical protein